MVQKNIEKKNVEKKIQEKKIQRKDLKTKEKSKMIFALRFLLPAPSGYFVPPHLPIILESTA